MPAIWTTLEHDRGCTWHLRRSTHGPQAKTRPRSGLIWAGRPLLSSDARDGSPRTRDRFIKQTEWPCTRGKLECARPAPARRGVPAPAHWAEPARSATNVEVAGL